MLVELFCRNGLLDQYWWNYFVELCLLTYLGGTGLMELCGRTVLVEHGWWKCIGGPVLVERSWWNGVGGTGLDEGGWLKGAYGMLLLELVCWNYVGETVLMEWCPFNILNIYIRWRNSGRFVFDSFWQNIMKQSGGNQDKSGLNAVFYELKF